MVGLGARRRHFSGSVVASRVGAQERRRTGRLEGETQLLTTVTVAGFGPVKSQCLPSARSPTQAKGRLVLVL